MIGDIGRIVDKVKYAWLDCATYYRKAENPKEVVVIRSKEICCNMHKQKTEDVIKPES